MWPFSSKPKPFRSAVDSATVDALLGAALKGRKKAGYRHLTTKRVVSVVTMTDVEAASTKAKKPWQADTWECEDIARDMVNEAQKIGANEGRSWALGILRAKAPQGPNLHVYVFAVVVTPDGRFAGRDVVFYDPTARMWSSAAKLQDVDFSML